MFDRVTAALHNANLTDKYHSVFIEQEVTDDVVTTCLQNREDMVLLTEIIPVFGHRLKFISEFRKTETTQQQEQAQQMRRSESPEIIILHEKAASNNSRISSSTTTTTTTTQVKIEPSSPSASTSSAFSTQSPTTATTKTTADFTSVIKNASDQSIKLYMKKLTELFSPSGFFMDETTFVEKHEENRSNAIEYFSSSYLEYKNSASQVKVKTENGEIQQVAVKMEKENEETFNLKMTDLHDEMQKKFEEYKEKNELRLSHYKATSRNILLEAEKLYTDKVKKLIDNCTDEEELKKKEQVMAKELISHLNNNIQNPHANPQFIAGLNEEFIQSKTTCFQDYLEVFQLKREEDEIVVNRAFEMAKNYYKKELEKKLKSKSFIEPAAFVRQDEKIFEKALKTCKDLKLTPSQEKELKETLRGIFKIYQDKNLLRKPTTSYAIGIDLGTTNSCVAVYINGKVEVIINDQGNRTTPSFVSFKDDGSVLVGDAAKDQSYRNPQNTIFDAKRLIGRNFEEKTVKEDIKSWPFDVINENGKPKIRIEMNSTPAAKRRKINTDSADESSSSSKVKNYHCEEISALVLRKLKMFAESYLGCEVKNACITVPALFNDYQRQATRDAGEIAGLNVLRIINEPTAAAISYSLHRTDEIKRNVLVFDLGGGTFDVSVLKIGNGKIKVKAVHGDAHLGGGDFDTEMVKHCIEYFKQEHGIDLARGRDSIIAKERFDVSCRLRRIRNECERQKKALSTTTQTEVGLELIDSSHPDLNLDVPFTRAQFESLNQKHFDRCIEIVQLALDEAEMKESDINDVVLVGGSTRIPRIQQMLSSFFDGKVLTNTINPDESVAEGAAIQACILSGQKVDGVIGMKLTDVTPFSIGIEDEDGDFDIQIPKNTQLPCTVTKDSNTVVDNQTGALFIIYEGEDKIAVNNNLLGEFFLEGIPPNKAGEEKLPTTTTINEEGILHVKAVCRSSGTSNEILITTVNNRMTRQEIEYAKKTLKSSRK